MKDQNNKKDNNQQVTSDFSNKSNEELVQEIQSLALTIDQVEDEKAELDNKFKKVLADYVNLEKSIDNRLSIQLAHMKKKVAESLIDIMDNVKLAHGASENLELNDASKSWVDGVLGTLSKMEKTLLEIGVEIVEVNKGDDFNSNLHEAVATVPEGENNKIFDVIQPGYRMGDQIIRAARVVVSKS